MSRPEILFPLFAELETLEGVGPKTAQAFGGLGVEKPKDLLFVAATFRGRPQPQGLGPRGGAALHGDGRG